MKFKHNILYENICDDFDVGHFFYFLITFSLIWALFMNK